SAGAGWARFGRFLFGPGGWRAAQDGVASRAHGVARAFGLSGRRGAWPVLIGVALGAAAAAAPPVQHAVVDGVARLQNAMLTRPEFAIRRLEVVGLKHLSEEALKDAVQAGAPRHADRAAWAFDYEGARRRIEALGWVRRASVVLQPPHTLSIEIIEREPAALFREGDRLTLVDVGGARIAPAPARAAHPTLPVLVGLGAPRRVAEALRLLRVAKAGGLGEAAMVRVGGRRWDMELRGGLRVMLPEERPQAALERVAAWARDAALLERGFEVLDMRLPFAPTARPRPTPQATQADVSTRSVETSETAPRD
ncbi:MAG: FtsQ-type POTRA domain-containing protein, partial [Pseudomonadota bacterium]